MKISTSKTRAIASLLTAFALTACGQATPSSEEPSDLEWIQSRSTTTRYAFLEQADLADEFVFGGSVINVEDFLSNALNMTIRPMNVKLSRRGTGTNRVVDVKTSAEAETLLSFKLGTREGRDEIDFASAGNDLKLRSLVATIGGMYTAMDENGYWVSEGAPVVARIQQDKNTLVADLVHTVRQAVTRTDIFGRTVVDHYVSETPGKVTVRIFLARKKTLPDLGTSRTLAQAAANNIGYFGTDLGSDDPATKIQRFALGDAPGAAQSITFYMKNVPTEFRDTARNAILSWNVAFNGQNRVRVADAPEWMDVGDPRYNVVKWFDGLDDEINWAGVAKMIVEPDTGLVMGGHLFLNGGSVLNMYRDITSYSQGLADAGIRHFEGTIGNVTFDRDEGETPVIPFMTDTTRSYEEYMQGYYLETIAHEVGHVLGLRHNFRGTTALVDEQSASVMDYAPRAERAHYAGPGFYDIAAIKWGYYGTVPATTLPFCTDDDIWTYFDCSQGDWGNAVDSAVHGLVDGTLLLSKSTKLVESDVLISSMGGALENALKIKKLQSQLPAATRAEAVRKIDAAYQYLYNATADAGASTADKVTINANLAKMREITRKKETELREAGRL